MRFFKLHGLGNDYVFINGFEERVDDPTGLAVRVSDRHRGVGGDGLILLLPPTAGAGADVRMRMFNKDGLEAEMCGNGIRCLCKLAHDSGVFRGNPMRVETARGVLTLGYELDASGEVSRVTVDMGEPVLDPGLIPLAGVSGSRAVAVPFPPEPRWPDPLDPDWAAAAGLADRFTAVSMGNPHAVIFCRAVDRVPLEIVGPWLERHPLFPRRANAHFVETPSSSRLRMRTWERGSGITMACGTGAAAACVAGALEGRSDRNVIVTLPGGDLAIDWTGSDGHVRMTGPATFVFSGEI